MIIGAAQSSSVRGDLQENTIAHLRFIKRAASAGCSLLVFPELSLIGYELDLAASIQLKRDDTRLEPIRRAAKKHQMHVVVGGPLTSEEERPYLGSLIVSPQRTVCYAKVHIPASESPYFISGENSCVVSVRRVGVGLAICADTSYPSHVAAVATRGAQLYVASIMKTEDEMANHAHRMKRYATSHRMAVLTSNYAGAKRRAGICRKECDLGRTRGSHCSSGFQRGVPVGGAPMHRMLARRGYFAPIVSRLGHLVPEERRFGH